MLEIVSNTRCYGNVQAKFNDGLILSNTSSQCTIGLLYGSAGAGPAGAGGFIPNAEAIMLNKSGVPGAGAAGGISAASP